MTEAEAIQYVRDHDDSDTLDPADLDAAFRAVYGRDPDEQDRAEGLWSHLCAAVDVDEEGD